jgi:hypothetical protein
MPSFSPSINLDEKCFQKQRVITKLIDGEWAQSESPRPPEGNLMQIASRRGVIFVNRNCILRKMTALPTLCRLLSVDANTYP